jgi:hypothetical protein
MVSYLMLTFYLGLSKPLPQQGFCFDQLLSYFQKTLYLIFSKLCKVELRPDYYFSTSDLVSFHC